MISTVNLLDCNQEPTDEQLHELMQSVALEAREKAKIANAALKNTIRQQAIEVFARQGLPLPQYE